ncbi:pentatricopeptide repeat-containing protein At2g22070 [Rhodamnia argentea]|uniref:Pentatricopeptide repeat-containing protein At2g22070 n=1 Tax=Rhodamnia argentea TaxID=178133 RepID=A0A8B8NY23_9MYRT|nr:pentatricopeptide repeat-containing protein At2g22070 [Rhodamnia argentea]
MMEISNPPPFPSPSDSYAYLLQTSLKNKDPFGGRSVHAQIIKSGLHFGLFLMNNLMNFYAKSEFVDDARRVFDEMPEKNTSSWNTILSMYAKQGFVDTAHCLFGEIPERDSVSWTAMIVGYNRTRRFVDAIQLFVDMLSERVLPTQYTLTNVLASCAAVKALIVGRKIHSSVVKLGLSSSVSVANSLLNMYAKSGDHMTAKMVFDRIKLKNTSSWNVMLSMHMLSGHVDLAVAQFDMMDERDIVSWNSMIAGFNQHGHDTEALNFFSRMLKDRSLKPDKFTLASVLSACANLENIRLGKEIHAYMVKSVFDMSNAVENALISMYAKSGEVETARQIVEKCGTSNMDIIAFTALLDGYVKLGDINPARQIFDLQMERDVVTWTAMIVGYVQNGLNDDAIEIFKRMLREGPRPNSYTLAVMLTVSASLASFNYGKQIHANAMRTYESSSVSVSNALINMYAKSGNINDARKVFGLAHDNRDTVSWTSMVIALAQHGLGEDALKLFEKMLTLGIKPDHITYVGVLSACTHIGLVEQGRRYYDRMRHMDKIEPTLSHCACMIDLYARAGLLHEAQRFIENMPIEPDVSAWGSLLASCRLYKNVELAKFAAEKLLIVDPDNSGAYSTLANLYMVCGKWEDAAKVRKSMKDRGVKKEQGTSWVQIRNEVHVFGVEDGLHPQKDAIYKTIDKIWKEIKKMGFVPDTESVMHDLEEEVKEQILRHHSEKLAIAFGLLNTPENTTLRIMKNLRICNDCHSAIKYIAKLAGREIVVRDSTRFHHFRDGTCSCRDYW